MRAKAHLSYQIAYPGLKSGVSVSYQLACPGLKSGVSVSYQIAYPGLKSGVSELRNQLPLFAKQRGVPIAIGRGVSTGRLVAVRPHIFQQKTYLWYCLFKKRESNIV